MSPPVPTSNNPYPPAYPASQSAPGSMRSIAGGSSGSQVLLATHVFAPVVTGAPTKKTKFPNTPGEFVTLPCSFLVLEISLFMIWFENSPCALFRLVLVPPLLVCFPQCVGFGYANWLVVRSFVLSVIG
jgi:hypothetical protein